MIAPALLVASFSPSFLKDSNMMECDVLVIGGGSAGLTAAKLASDTLQKDCILIEAERLGGAYSLNMLSKTTNCKKHMVNGHSHAPVCVLFLFQATALGRDAFLPSP
jgi:glycine/D-amino acid oxidase-like deaminating enzyme